MSDPRPQEILQAADTAATYTITLVNANGDTLSYTGAETLTAKIWAGDDRLVSSTLTPTWVTAPNVVSLTIPAATAAALGVGVFYVRVYVNGGADHGAEAMLRILPAPGSTTTEQCYCTAEDLRKLSRAIDQFQTYPDDQTGFYEDRRAATQWFESVLHRAYTTTKPAFPANEIYKYGNPFFNALPGGRDATLQGYLDNGQLILTDQVKRCVAAYALGLIFRRNWSGTAWTPNGTDQVRNHAEYWEREAQRLAVTLRVEIDLSDPLDGTGDLIIPLDQVALVRR